MLKRYKNLLCYTVLFLLMSCIITGFATDYVDIIIDGVTLQEKGVVVNDRTLLPVRDLAEAMGATVTWDDSTQKVGIHKTLWSKSQTTEDITPSERDIYMWIGKNNIMIGVSNVDTDVPPQIINDKTMLPVRIICELLEAKVEWIESESTVKITKGLNNSSLEAEVSDIQTKQAQIDYINKLNEGLDSYTELRFVTEVEGSVPSNVYYFIYNDPKLPIGFYYQDFEKWLRTDSMTWIPTKEDLVYSVPNFNIDNIEVGKPYKIDGVYFEKLPNGTIQFDEITFKQVMNL